MLIDIDTLDEIQTLLHSERAAYEHAFTETLIATNRVALLLELLCRNAIATSLSATRLLANDDIWTCEMLIRSVAEGTLKIQYILADDTKIEQKVDEFLEALDDIGRLRQHELLTKSRDLLDRADLSTLMAPHMLSQEEHDELSRRYSRADRQRLLKTWSFSGMVDILARSNDAYNDLPLTMLPYSIGSQVLHQDCGALRKQWAREVMPWSRRAVEDRGHATREVTDIVTSVAGRTACIARLFPGEIDELKNTSYHRMLELQADCLRLN